MKREELKAYDCNEGSYDSMGFPWEYKEMVYDKAKADKVMDAMERRIARLTALVDGYKKNSLVLGEMYHKRLAQEQARIQELESIPHTDNTAVIEALQRDKDDLIELNEKRIAQIKELESQLSKWISVEDVLPQWGKLVKIKFKDGKEDERRFSADYKWVSKGMQTCESVNVTNWQPLPPPPSIVDSSATEKENG